VCVGRNKNALQNILLFYFTRNNGIAQSLSGVVSGLSVTRQSLSAQCNALSQAVYDMK